MWCLDLAVLVDLLVFSSDLNHTWNHLGLNLQLIFKMRTNQKRENHHNKTSNVSALCRHLTDFFPRVLYFFFFFFYLSMWFAVCLFSNFSHSYANPFLKIKTCINCTQLYYCCYYRRSVAPIQDGGWIHECLSSSETKLSRFLFFSFLFFVSFLFCRVFSTGIRWSISVNPLLMNRTRTDAADKQLSRLNDSINVNVFRRLRHGSSAGFPELIPSLLTSVISLLFI